METLFDSSHMQGKVSLVTGASSGIGKAAAMELATMGAEVILVGRNEQRTSQAAAEITAWLIAWRLSGSVMAVWMKGSFG